MNYAARMYRKVGFEIVDENDEEYIMICKRHAQISGFVPFCKEK